MLELHPLCTLFPRLSGAEFDALREDIKTNGLNQPIIVHQGMILDGGNRYRACIDAGVEPTFKEFDGGNIVAFVLSANLHRRHMSPGQQAAIVASAQDWAKAQGVGKPKSVHENTLATTQQRAAASGASVMTQRRADKVAKADPELAKKVAHGEISLPKAVEKVSPKKVEPEQIPEPEPEDFGPSAEELAAAEAEEKADRERVAAMLDSDDAMAALVAENKRLVAENFALKVSRDSYMNQCTEQVRMIKSLQRKLDKLNREAA